MATRTVWFIMLVSNLILSCLCCVISALESNSSPRNMSAAHSLRRMVSGLVMFTPSSPNLLFSA